MFSGVVLTKDLIRSVIDYLKHNLYCPTGLQKHTICSVTEVQASAHSGPTTYSGPKHIGI